MNGEHSTPDGSTDERSVEETSRAMGELRRSTPFGITDFTEMAGELQGFSFLLKTEN